MQTTCWDLGGSRTSTCGIDCQDKGCSGVVGRWLFTGIIPGFEVLALSRLPTPATLHRLPGLGGSLRAPWAGLLPCRACPENLKSTSPRLCSWSVFSFSTCSKTSDALTYHREINQRSSHASTRSHLQFSISGVQPPVFSKSSWSLPEVNRTCLESGHSWLISAVAVW